MSARWVNIAGVTSNPSTGGPQVCSSELIAANWPRAAAGKCRRPVAELREDPAKRASAPNHRLELDALIRYEMARLGLWRAICKRNPQLALFSEVYGDSPSESVEWAPSSTSGALGEPVHLTEPRWLASGAEPQHAPQNNGVLPVAPIPPDAATGSAPYAPTSNGGQ